jgi:hypothetical protein
MIRETNGPMRGQYEARSPIVSPCSPCTLGNRPCPMVLHGQCRNCSDRLIPPYAVHLQASALRPRTATLIEFICGNLLTQVS